MDIKDNPILPYAELTIDETTYKFIYSFNAIAEAEKLTGLELLTGHSRLVLGKDIGAMQFRALVYAALKTAQPEMTLEDAGNLIVADTFDPLQKAVFIAYMNSMKDEDKKKVCLQTLNELWAMIEAPPA